MIDLCLSLSFISLSWWQVIYIETELLYVRLDITNFNEFKTAICNFNFIEAELVRG
tara:strand:+ start:2409 stop:2576 length:168 start_codon:yes stop_codon:yes gene_type:complete